MARKRRGEKKSTSKRENDKSSKSAAKKAAPAPEPDTAEKPGTWKSVLAGLSDVTDITVKKAKSLQLAAQLNELERKIGRAAFDKNVDAGGPGEAVNSAAELLEHLAQKLANASASLKSAEGVKASAWAATEITAIKTRQAKAQLELRLAFEKLGTHILSESIPVPGSEPAIVQARELQAQLAALNAEVSNLGGGLKEKWDSLWGKR